MICKFNSELIIIAQNFCQSQNRKALFTQKLRTKICEEKHNPDLIDH